VPKRARVTAYVVRRLASFQVGILGFSFPVDGNVGIRVLPEREEILVFLWRHWAWFSLTNSDGSWTLTDVHDFTGGSDGANPSGGVVLDSSSNLYGTANLGSRLSGPCTLTYPGRHGKANRKTVGDPEFLSTQKGEGRPEVTATYCFPFSA